MEYKLIKEYPGSPLLNTITTSIYMTDWKGSNYYDYWGEYWEKVNKDTIITEDGITIMSDEPYWAVDPVNYELIHSAIDSKVKEDKYKKFAIKKNAKKYIKNNQKCLCMEDVLEVLKEKGLI